MKDIFKRICYAQIASDGGKNIETLKSFAPVVWRKGYTAKDREILRAISLINNGDGYGVKYSVAKDYYSKSLNRQCYIDYFTYLLDGKRKQISFHTFSNLENYVATDIHIVRWDRKISRKNVWELLTHNKTRERSFYNE